MIAVGVTFLVVFAATGGALAVFVKRGVDRQQRHLHEFTEQALENQRQWRLAVIEYLSQPIEVEVETERKDGNGE